MKALKQFLFRQAERRLKKIPLLSRGQARFNLHFSGKYTIGFGSYGLPQIHDWNEGATLEIGSFCSIATNVQIFLGGHHHAEWITTYPLLDMLNDVEDAKVSCGFTRGNVLIGNDVWLCSNSIVLSGVSIGDGAIVAAGAVVTRDVAPYSVVAGNPARHIRWRFDEQMRKKLLAIAWWGWPEEEIVRMASVLCSNDFDALFEYANQRSR